MTPFFFLNTMLKSGSLYSRWWRQRSRNGQVCLFGDLASSLCFRIQSFLYKHTLLLSVIFQIIYSYNNRLGCAWLHCLNQLSFKGPVSKYSHILDNGCKHFTICMQGLIHSCSFFQDSKVCVTLLLKYITEIQTCVYVYVCMNVQTVCCICLNILLNI